MTQAHNETFGDRLRRLRAAASLTQEQLAERAGLTVKAVSALERGERQHPYPHTVRALADALGLAGEDRAALAAAVPRRGDAGPNIRQRPLPVPLTPLLGRETDVAELARLLARPDVRLLTMLGPGGVGKTRLALELAEALSGTFADGALFIALAAVSVPSLVCCTIAAALDVREGAGQSVTDALCEALRDRQLLLVLDNFEHVLPAAADVTQLLAACPRLTVLVTSRAALRVRGEQTYTVAPLALPARDQAGKAAQVAAAPAAQLFVQRAQAVASGFVLSDSNAEAVAAICRRLDGLPLALELAAARVRLLPPAALLARLDGVLPLLTAGAHDLPARQQTMRHAIAWSYDLLSPDEQRLFRRLGVFAGGWTIEAAEAVCADVTATLAEGEASDVLQYRQPSVAAGHILDGLDALLSQSLLVQEEDFSGAPRLAMLETIRAYALEQLAEHGETTIAADRHAAYYRALVEAAGAGLRASPQVTWFERVDRERDNIRAALLWLVACGELDMVAGMAWDLWLFWWVRGYQPEGLQLMQEVLGRQLSPHTRAVASAVACAMACAQHDFAACERYAAEALVLARQLGDTEREAHALTGLGLAALGAGAPATALGWFEAAAQVYYAAGDDGRHAGIRAQIALAQLRQQSQAAGTAQPHADGLPIEGDELIFGIRVPGA
jgi:predicted ATPase/DNA-binding XRE family transcriptional regulator